MFPAEIDFTSRKHILWHGLRHDLQKYIPEIAQNQLLLCHAAINGLGNEGTTNQKMISVISEYLQARDLPALDGTVKNVVGKMVKKWKTHDMPVVFL